VGRNHPLIEGLAEHLMDLAFHPSTPSPSQGEGRGEGPVARCGVVRTPRVTRRSALFLLRLRYLHLDGDGAATALAEETVAWGLAGVHPAVSELDPTEALRLLDGPLDAVSVPRAERQEVLRETLGWWPLLEEPLAKMLAARAGRLAEEHSRLADLVGSTAKLMQRETTPYVIEPQSPPDMLGLVVLLPVIPRGVNR